LDQKSAGRKHAPLSVTLIMSNEW